MPIVTPNPKITPNLYNRHNLSIFIIISIVIVLVGTFIGSFVYRAYVNKDFTLGTLNLIGKNPDDDFKVVKKDLPFKTADIADDKQVFTLSDQPDFAIEYPKDWKVETRAEDVTKTSGGDKLSDKFILLTKDTLKLQVNLTSTADPSTEIPNCYLQGQHKLISNDKFGVVVDTDPEGKIISNFGAIVPIENFIVKDYPATTTDNDFNKDKDKSKYSFCQNEVTKKIKKAGSEFVNIDLNKDVESFTQEELKSLLEVAKTIKGITVE